MNMLENVLDNGEVMNMVYAEGFDDALRGDNYNPYDFQAQHDEWESYEHGYLQGVMSGHYDENDGQPNEAQEWADYDIDC